MVYEMPKASSNIPSTSDLSDMSYEDAVSELKKIIDLSEAGEIPLDQMVNNYDYGMNLLKHCQKHLNLAEMRIMEQEKQSNASDL